MHTETGGVAKRQQSVSQFSVAKQRRTLIAHVRLCYRDPYHCISDLGGVAKTSFGSICAVHCTARPNKPWTSKSVGWRVFPLSFSHSRSPPPPPPHLTSPSTLPEVIIPLFHSLFLSLVFLFLNSQVLPFFKSSFLSSFLPSLSLPSFLPLNRPSVRS